jgi:hypothetical protein
MRGKIKKVKGKGADKKHFDLNVVCSLTFAFLLLS